jgi:hypothetical protein
VALGKAAELAQQHLHVDREAELRDMLETACSPLDSRLVK